MKRIIIEIKEPWNIHKIVDWIKNLPVLWNHNVYIEGEVNTFKHVFPL